MTSASPLGALGCALLVGLAACGPDRPGEERPAGGVEAAAAPLSDGTARAPSTPESGVRAWLEGDGLVGVVANEATRRDVLNALADAAGFVLSVGPEVDLDQPLALRVEREPLEVTLGRALIGVPHAFFYAADPASRANRLSRVTVGIEWTRLAESTHRAPPGEPPAARRAPTVEEKQERPTPRPAPRERAPARRAASVVEKLQSADEDLRGQAVLQLDVSSREGFEAATDRLARDESPLVRAAAAEALIKADQAAVRPLLDALDDPDSRVVLGALLALEFVGDDTVARQLDSLLVHSDAQVRERAQEVIEVLQ